MSKNNWGGARKGAGRASLKECDKRKGVKIYITDEVKSEIISYGKGSNFSEQAVELITSELKSRKNTNK